MQHKVLGSCHCEQCAHHSQLHSLAIALAAFLDQGHHLHSTIVSNQICMCLIRQLLTSPAVASAALQDQATPLSSDIKPRMPP